MSSMALTWAFTSSVAKSSGYMLTSANVIIVSVIIADFLYRKTMPTSVFSQVRIEISTQSYSNFGLKQGHWALSRPSPPATCGPENRTLVTTCITSSTWLAVTSG